jgi:sugar phosphate isomerase/epimerase
MAIRQGFMIDASVPFDAGVDFAAEHGFDFVELNMEHPFFRDLDADRVRAATSDRGLDVVAHLPYRLDVGSPHEHVRDGACRQLEAAVDTAVACGAETGVFHATTTVSAEGWGADALRANIYESVRRVAAHAREAGVTAAVENVKRPYFDAGDFPDLFAETDADACLDTGHAHAMGHDGGDQAALIREHGDRITHVHLNETRQPDRDEHLPLGHGVVDFASVARAMVETGWSGTCTHEIYSWHLDSRASSKAIFDGLLADARA